MRRLLFCAAIFTLVGCASRHSCLIGKDARFYYRMGYEDGVRDAITVVERKNAEYYKRILVRKVRVPASVTGNAFLPAHDEYVMSPVGVRDAFTPGDAERIAEGLSGIGNDSITMGRNKRVHHEKNNYESDSGEVDW